MYNWIMSIGQNAVVCSRITHFFAVSGILMFLISNAHSESESPIIAKRPLQVVHLKTPQAIIFGTGDSCKMKFTLVIDKGFHTMVNKTEIVFDEMPHINVNVTKYPKGQDFFVKAFGKSTKVYESEVELPVLAKLRGDKSNRNSNQIESKKVVGRLKFQACSEKTCLMPQELPFSIDLKTGRNADCETESNQS